MPLYLYASGPSVTQGCMTPHIGKVEDGSKALCPLDAQKIVGITSPLVL